MIAVSWAQRESPSAEDQSKEKKEELGFYQRTIEKVRKFQEVAGVIPREMLFNLMKKEMERLGYEGYVNRHPKVLLYVVDVIQHPTALVNFLKALGRFDYWALYGGFLVFSFLAMSYGKRRNRRRQVTRINRFVVSCLLYICFLGIGNLFSFYWVFRRELKPFIQIAFALDS